MKEYDTVVVSGYCASAEKFVYHMKAVVGTVTDREVKLWPIDGRWDGKLWFYRRTLRIHTNTGSIL
jgi:hypothetical protein